MTKILVDKAVIEQALEAFELYAKQYPHMVKGYTLDAEEALRNVLQQPQVEQGPVAWAVMQGGSICWEADYPFSNEPGWCDSDQQSVPLYIHPQLPRQPLTEMEIVELRQLTPGTLDVQFVKFARAIEKAHSIGESNA